METFLQGSCILGLLIQMKKMLVAYDGSEASKKALEMIKKCANTEDEITLLTVVPRACRVFFYKNATSNN